MAAESTGIGIYALRFTICDLRFAICDLRCGLAWKFHTPIESFRTCIGVSSERHRLRLRKWPRSRDAATAYEIFVLGLLSIGLWPVAARGVTRRVIKRIEMGVAR